MDDIINIMSEYHNVRSKSSGLFVIVVVLVDVVEYQFNQLNLTKNYRFKSLNEIIFFLQSKFILYVDYTTFPSVLASKWSNTNMFSSWLFRMLFLHVFYQKVIALISKYSTTKIVFFFISTILPSQASSTTAYPVSQAEQSVALLQTVQWSEHAAK